MSKGIYFLSLLAVVAVLSGCAIGGEPLYGNHTAGAPPEGPGLFTGEKGAICVGNCD
ncbi:hypothetical protein [Beggiatoa leptomitoformis]|uniref:Lipoprotein n=1 Tax=Beggiatoa leptomitoformis TaxID=288004 RepID=A0A650GCF5_9GAMM|nr:hypothetical protein [Beggiatoa leptomitoformis]QGX03611.1 hypothetical protein AL038_18735 [Beggiatoa leptomitoformis]QGX04065.1 hypothetical protein BLE401_18560 [Beggiatoa leptomitoformis]